MITATLDFIKKDRDSHPVRYMAEVIGMVLGLGDSVILAMTTPNPPLLLCYIIWEVASVLLVCAAYSRGSLGFTALYAGFFVIDLFGLLRTVGWL
jgi:hypothetical protein